MGPRKFLTAEGWRRQVDEPIGQESKRYDDKRSVTAVLYDEYRQHFQYRQFLTGLCEIGMRLKIRDAQLMKPPRTIIVQVFEVLGCNHLEHELGIGKPFHAGGESSAQCSHSFFVLLLVGEVRYAMR